MTYGLLAATGVGACLLPRELGPASASAFAPAPLSETMILPTTIRDFRAAHGDFGVTLAGGNGHYAGNVAFTLPASERPAYVATGYRVSTQWRDVAANPIAPHMYIDHAVGRTVRLGGAPTFTNNPIRDTFDSTQGPYGPGNIGPAPNFVTGSAMPVIAPPTGLPAKIVDYIRQGNGTTTLATDVHCEKFVVQDSHVLRISGHRTIYAEELFKVQNSAQIQILAGSSLTLYTGKDVLFENSQQVNMNTGNPSLFRIFHLATQELKLENSASIYAHIVAPNGTVKLENECHVYGTLLSKGLTMENTAGLHIDTLGYGRVCGVLANDSLGTKGANSAAGVASAATFSQWYVDTLGVNLSTGHDLVLTKDGAGVWQYSNNAFFPIDGRLFGNESMSHNFYFTLAGSTAFTHHACDGRFFEFTGADDFWLFVDGQLVLDIGGVVPMQKQRIDIDRLSLNNGQTYRLDLFYAQRNPSVSSFHLRTNLDLHAAATGYTVSAGHD